MRHLILAAAAAAMLCGPAAAQDVVIDAAGPDVGPVIVVGPPDPVRQYVIANPRPAVVLEGRIEEGFVVPPSVDMVPVPDEPDYVYFYDDAGRPVIVSADDRSVVTIESTTAALPDDAIPDEVIGYIRQNPSDDLVLEGRIEDGYVVPPEADLAPIDGYDGYSYFYHDGLPYVVSNADRRVVYIAR